jgi:sortase (surface protein transpeptidase)
LDAPRDAGRRSTSIAVFTAVVLTVQLGACATSAGPERARGGSPDVVVSVPDQSQSATPRHTPAPVLATPPALPSAPDSFVFPGRASRVIVPAMGIDLPVVSGDSAPPPGNFPLCNVAQYLTTYRQPGEEGTTYLYAHARTGMFLPLLEASMRADGAEMIGMEVLVYSSDAMRYRYRVFEVQRHVVDYRLANSTPPGERRLILQTSEGPRGTEGKLVVAAELVDVEPATDEEANPPAEPVVCE